MIERKIKKIKIVRKIEQTNIVRKIKTNNKILLSFHFTTQLAMCDKDIEMGFTSHCLQVPKVDMMDSVVNLYKSPIFNSLSIPSGSDGKPARKKNSIICFVFKFSLLYSPADTHG